MTKPIAKRAQTKTVFVDQALRGSKSLAANWPPLWKGLLDLRRKQQNRLYLIDNQFGAIKLIGKRLQKT